MSIVKMKRLRLVGLTAERDQFLQLLQPMGCVEIDEPTDLTRDERVTALLKSDVGRTGMWESEARRLTDALAVLDKYAPAKTPMFAPRPKLTGRELFDDEVRRRALDAAEQLAELAAGLERLDAAESRLAGERMRLEPWKELDVPLDCIGTRHTKAALITVPAAAAPEALEQALEQAAEYASLVPLGSDRELQYSFLLYHGCAAEAVQDALRLCGGSVVTFPDRQGTARDNLRALQQEEDLLTEKRADTLEAIKGLGGARASLKTACDRAVQEAEREKTRNRLLTDGQIFVLDGWIPAPQEQEVTDFLADFCCCWELSDPQEGDNVPTKLENNALTKPLTMVTEMYSLPAYTGVDPNPLMLPFFSVFFGIMFADMGYGLILIAVWLFATLKAKPRGTLKYMAGLCGICGVTTFLFGAMIGGFFGDAIPVIASMCGKTVTIPALFSPLDDPLMVLIGALALGAVHIIAGMAIKGWMLIRKGQWLDAVFDIGSWWLLFAGIAFGALGITWWVCIAGVAALILTQGRHKKGIFGKLIGGISSLYDITSYLGDILSYTRLMALMLAGGVIASIMNTLGSFTGGMVGFIPIFLIGHALNFGLNVLGCYVHTSRLMYLEYFGKFYEDGGRPFTPLQYKTKYVDIVKEAN